MRLFPSPKEQGISPEGKGSLSQNMEQKTFRLRLKSPQDQEQQAASLKINLNKMHQIAEVERTFEQKFV